MDLKMFAPLCNPSPVVFEGTATFGHYWLASEFRTEDGGLGVNLSF